MRAVWLLLLAGCGSDGPDLTVSMAVPITQSINGGTSVFDPIVNHTLDFEFVSSSMPHEQGMDASTGCTWTDFDMSGSARTATGELADLVQRELLNRMTNWKARLALCPAGQSSTIRISVGDLEQLEAWFTCFVPASANTPDSAGYPRLVSFTSTMCDATIDDISAQRNFMSAMYTTTFAVGPGSLP